MANTDDKSNFADVGIDPNNQPLRTAEVQSVTVGQDDLASPNDSNMLKVTLNETHVKFISTEWVTGDGRAAGSTLAKQLLGTKEGLQGSTNLTIDEKFLPVFDLLLTWLSKGDTSIQSEVREENASLLVGLAQYFGLEKLEDAIHAEKAERERESKKKSDESISQVLASINFNDIINPKIKRARDGRPLCVCCKKTITVARTYKGHFPRCINCR